MSAGDIQGLDLSSVISKLKENPELISKVASAFAASPSEKDSGADTSGTPATINPEIISKLLPTVASLGSLTGETGGERKQTQNPRCELLRALRPFLSPKRCEAIDYMIKMDGLSGLFSNFKPQ